MNRLWRVLAMPASMKGMLLLLVTVVLVPLLAVQVGLYTAWYAFLWSDNRRANLDEAQAAAATFDVYVRGILRQQATLGLAMADLMPDAPQQANALLAATAKKYPYIHQWVWISAEGLVLASNETESVGKNVAKEPFFQHLRTGRKSIVGPVVLKGAGGQPTFMIARRIEDADAKLLGFMASEVQADELEGRAVISRKGVGGNIVIFDSQGVLIHPKTDENITWQTHRHTDQLLAEALQSGHNAQGVFKRPEDGRKILAARVPMQESSWVAGADLSIDQAMAPVKTALWIAGSLNALIAVVSALVALAIGGRLIGQLRQLQAHADAISRGELGHSTTCGGVRELAELADAFNRMGESVRNVHDAQQQSLHGQARVLEAFFHHTFTCLAILDRQFNFVHVNEAYAQACGREMTDFPGLNYFALYPDPQRESVFRSVLRDKTPYQAFAQPFVFPDHPEWGTTYWDWNLVPILNQSGNVDFLVFSLNNITERKRAEAELLEHREHLSELVAQRTKELQETNRQLAEEVVERQRTEEELKRTADQLARSNEDLEQFAYIASHDLQEPLRVVSSYVQLLARKYRGALDADADKFIDYLVEGVARMQQLIVDLLNYSRLDTRGQPFSPVEMQAALDRALANLRSLIEESGADVKHGELPRINADETQMTQLFQNLISNAIKFRDQRPPQVYVSAERREEGWEFRVCDNGIGIEQQYWDKVFLVFQRLHSRRKYEGTGIGLAACKRIVERHGGRIWLDSQPGEGTTVFFTIPLTSEHPA